MNKFKQFKQKINTNKQKNDRFNNFLVNKTAL